MIDKLSHISKSGAENSQSRFFLKGIKPILLALFFVIVFCDDSLAQSPKSRGTRIAKSLYISSEIEQDTILEKSGIIRSYSESDDVLVAEVFIKEGQSISSVSIFNMLGKQVETIRTNNRVLIDSKDTGKIYSYRINSSRLTPGMYIIAVEGTDFKDVERFVKSR